MAEFVMRGFAWSDVPALAAIYRHYVETSTATFEIEAPSDAVIAERLGKIADLGHPLVIAEVNGVPAGYAYAGLHRPRAAYRFTCEDTIYLAPKAVGQGIGTALLARLAEAAAAAGFKQMIAVITAESEPSIRMHEKLGFKLVGRYAAVGYKFERWLDTVHMQRGI